MKLAFSTLGCPGWSWNEIFATAKDLGLDGIEVRGIGDEIYAPNVAEFSSERLPQVIEQLKNAKMEIPMLTSAACLGTSQATAMEEARAYIELAARMKASFVRVMISPVAAPEQADIAKCGELYAQLCAFGKQNGVTPLIETNGLLADSVAMKDFMEKYGADGGVLWDIHHPYRFFGETPAKTWGNIGKWVKYAHVKDSAMVDDAVTYRMMGYGDVPVMDALQIMHQNGYEGYVTFEWLKRWCPDLQEPGIVFSHFASYMGFLLKQLA